MFKCADCGNIEKFIGYAEESGKAIIYQNDSIVKDKEYEWSYISNNNDWQYSFKIKRCFFCSSENIIVIH